MKRGAVSTVLLGSTTILLAVVSSNAFGAGNWLYVLVLAEVLVLAILFAVGICGIAVGRVYTGMRNSN